MNKKYELLLFDLDNTLLDFEIDQKKALKYVLESIGYTFNNDILEEYKKIDTIVWNELEQGKIKTVAELFEKRGKMILKKCNITENTKHFNKLLDEGYQNGGTAFETAEEILKLCSEKCKMGIVTNGPKNQQYPRLKHTGLDKYMSYIFVSEEIGYNKPDINFFNYVFNHIDETDKTKILVIGDSLTSDIQGGINANLDTCWFNRKNKSNNTQITANYEIRNLEELINII